MSLYAQFQTDKNIEKDGVVLEYGLNSKKKVISIRIARAGGANTHYAKLLESKIKPYRRQIQNETLDNAVAEKLTKEVYAQSVVLGWENVEDQDGNELAFNQANFTKLMDDLPDLWADIQNQATRAALFRSEILEADAKN
jgi:hypothetical protein